MTIGKTIALTRWTFVDKVMSLLFNSLSSFVTVLLPMSNYILILWLQSLSAVVLEFKKIKSAVISTFSHLFDMNISVLFYICSHYCFLACIQASQETGKVISYFHLFKNIPVCCDPYSQRKALI